MTVPVVAAADGAPRVPGDLEDDGGDREADQRVGDGEAEGDRGGAGDDGEADVGVRAGVVAVGDEGGAVEATAGGGADAGGEGVAGPAEQAGGGEGDEVVDLLGVDQSPHRLDPGDAGGDEDRQDDEVAGAALGPLRAQGEGDPERDRRRRVAEVVDQVGEQGDAAGEDEDRRLRSRRQPEDQQREEDSADPLARALDRGVDEPMGVAMPVAQLDGSFRRVFSIRCSFLRSRLYSRSSSGVRLLPRWARLRRSFGSRPRSYISHWSGTRPLTS
jgi:hypothetical protein